MKRIRTENVDGLRGLISPAFPGKTVESRERFRREVLLSLGAAAGEIDDLLAYGRSRYAGSELPSFPLPDEPFVSTWRDYAEEAARRGVFPVLQEKLVQLRFPIREGISRDDAYRAATLRGAPPDSAQPPLELNDPEGMSLFLHEAPAGTIPVITVRERSDFVALVRALSMRNEPGPVPESMGAVTIAGFNNWDRIARHRRDWEATHPVEAAAGGWTGEFQLLKSRKELYQDRFIVLSEGGYSSVAAETVHMSDDAWRRTSKIIRLEHECAHYVTRRAFGSMNDAVHDELIADRAGIAAAAGVFRADWFLLFMGLEDYPHYRPGGRLQNYLGDLQPGSSVFAVLTRLVKDAAENLDRFERGMREAGRGSALGNIRMLLALAELHMEELASAEAGRFIEAELQKTNSECSGKTI